jgi:histidine triad (HIT) family protein
MNCIFCQIIQKQTPAEIVYEDEQFIVFNDIRPKAAVHLLLVPKKHIHSVKDLKEEDGQLMGQLIILARKIAEEKTLAGYKLVLNVGREGGQIVDHLHLHLLAGPTKESQRLP